MTEPEIITTAASQEAEVVACVQEQSEDTAKNVHAMSKEELLAELRQIVDNERVNAHRDVMSIKQALFSLRQREVNEEMNAYVEAGNAPETFSATPDAVEAEAKDLVAKFRVLRQAYLEAEEKRMEENLAARREILEQMQTIAADADNVNVHFPKFQELQQQFRQIKEVTPSAESEIWKQFQSVVEQFYDTLKMNKDLCDVIWEEFKEASAVVNRRHQEFFEKRKAEEKVNEEAKTALCEEIEGIDLSALKTFAAWDEATARIKDMQAKWKTLGYASKEILKRTMRRYSVFRANGAQSAVSARSTPMPYGNGLRQPATNFSHSARSRMRPAIAKKTPIFRSSVKSWMQSRRSPAISTAKRVCVRSGNSRTAGIPQVLCRSSIRIRS